MVYEDLRLKYPNLEDDDQKTSFFSDVLERREKLEEEDMRRTQDTLVAGDTTDSS